jgi:putative endonuclease
VKQYDVDILARRPGEAPQLGVSNDLVRRIARHEQGLMPGHTKRYAINKLVCFEPYADMREAIQREKNKKHWPRVYKTRLLARPNPTWRDLNEETI